MSYIANVSKIAQRAGTPAQVDTSKGRQAGNISSRSPSPRLKNILGFCRLLSPILRGFDKNDQIKVYFRPLFALIRYLFALLECRRNLEMPGGNICRLVYRECATNDTHPPPFGERQVPSTPIIFRTKNTAKSRLGLIGKNFGKNLRENVSGKRKPPILRKGGKGC